MGAPVIVVVGSVNMDLVVRVPAFPRGGETVAGMGTSLHPGGKGANQAVAAARLGAHTHLVARVGDDEFGLRLGANLDGQDVSTTFVTVTESVPTGTATILVNDATGENAIALSAGANAFLTPADVDRAIPLMRTASAVIVQLEIPPATAAHVITVCHRHRVPVMLDPAPVPKAGLGAELSNVSVLSPNAGEAAALVGAGVGPAVAMRPRLMAEALIAKGAAAVLLKLGENGAAYLDQSGSYFQSPGFRVKTVDTTAAGDAFLAAFAVARGEGRGIPESLRFANAAGALATTVHGAQPSLPRRAAVDDILARWS